MFSNFQMLASACCLTAVPPTKTLRLAHLTINSIKLLHHFCHKKSYQKQKKRIVSIPKTEKPETITTETHIRGGITHSVAHSFSSYIKTNILPYLSLFPFLLPSPFLFVIFIKILIIHRPKFQIGT